MMMIIITIIVNKGAYAYGINGVGEPPAAKLTLQQCVAQTPFNVETSDAAILHSVLRVADGLTSPGPRPAHQH